ncbi:MAG: CRISPR-associated endonuclease Cas2 [Rhodothermales bacterium]
MGYVIAVYDAGVKRGPKLLKLFRRYLNWGQNSVFEGELTNAQLAALQGEAADLIDPDEDLVIFYRLRDERYAERSILGRDTANRDRML